MMKTVLMSTQQHFGSHYDGSSAASESAIDAYATRVLETMSPPDAFIDTSLGPYVTSLLRCAQIDKKEEVIHLAEFDSLLELLEDQGNMQREVATNALKTIAEAVCTGTVPHEAGSRTQMGLYVEGGFDSFYAMKSGLPVTQAPSQKNSFEQLSIEPYTPTAAGGPSPLKPDNLIPVDLLGFLDDPSPTSAPHEQSQNSIQELPPVEKQVTNDDEAFPPLGASVSAPSKKGGRGKKGKKAHSDKDLAAALFRPARARQNNTETEGSPQMKPAVPASIRMANASNNIFFQQQLDSCVEILLSMNPELSEEAAAEAGLMANTDFNIAQYIVDSAVSAPPVCRHMLHDGCYRSDCQFSHDVEGHTCLFWLRGRCGKGTSCKFLHGFNEKLLDGIQMEVFGIDPSAETVPVPVEPSNHGDGYSPNPYSSFQPSSVPNSVGFGGSSQSSGVFDSQGYENTQLGASWQSPSLTEMYGSSASAASSSFSFANIASRGYNKTQYSSTPDGNGSTSPTGSHTARIPQDMWNPNENRDASAFHIPDPMERYETVAATVARRDVIDLHFQSTKTFPVVLVSVLPEKLAEFEEVWVVTGTGHHVGSKTHQKGGGALERAVNAWLTEEGYSFKAGRDRNGMGGAVLVKR